MTRTTITITRTEIVRLRSHGTSKSIIFDHMSEKNTIDVLPIRRETKKPLFLQESIAENKEK